MHFRRYLIAGLLVWIPIGFTLFVLNLVIGLMDRTLLLLPLAYQPEHLLGIKIPGLGILLSIIVLLLTGMLVANFIGKRFVSASERLLNRIPLVRSIYSASKNFAEVLFTNTSQAFKKVLLIEYPRKGVYSLCFQTSTELAEIQARTSADMICVFVPTTPNPTSGFIIMVPVEDTIELDMDIESALKMIVSLGVVVPPWVREKHALEADDHPAAT
ncbi:MAG: DUF502 domain-containing protein [Gammaproteobacteria bacterium]|jgi:uncharacterized membrane protein|nr:hypothetical protein [Chromatiales bacterium]MCP4926825.1 DUF502 domain-containing protein [Gammaproteobacteria bacterium]MDP7296710.1 DUF502 domain-containing protein [Gammaproteobacteria bacterium]MDP7420072.1 DUF502 domain-containing protein [Gammaproteobacteria bacterium]MDP7660550.1 DUF502 domain-containing protein [Gammaproteobacteria bacterium]